MPSYQCARCNGGARTRGLFVCSRNPAFCAKCCRLIAANDSTICPLHPLAGVPAAAAAVNPPAQPAQPPQGQQQGQPPQQQVPQQPQPGPPLPPLNLPPLAITPALLLQLQAAGFSVSPLPQGGPSAVLNQPVGLPLAPLPPPPQPAQVQGALPQALLPPVSHLHAFGLPGPSGPQSGVSPPSHIVNLTNTTHINNGNPQATGLFSSMTDGLRPMAAGEGGPTMEQLLGRNMKSWRPYQTADEFRQALRRWVTREILGHPSDARHAAAASAYAAEVQHILAEVGLKQAFTYHKAAFDAANDVPPLYDPFKDGPRFWPGWTEHVQPHLNRRGGFRRGASFNTAASSGGSSGRGTKRARPADGCTIHPGANHTNSECYKQQTDKRRTSDRVATNSDK